MHGLITNGGTQFYGSSKISLTTGFDREQIYRSVMRTCEPMLSFIPFGLTCSILVSLVDLSRGKGVASADIRRHKSDGQLGLITS